MGIRFHAVVVFGLGKNRLFKSVLGHCDFLAELLNIWPVFWHTYLCPTVPGGVSNKDWKGFRVQIYLSDVYYQDHGGGIDS